MVKLRRICLRLSSNANQYQLRLFDGCNYFIKTINENRTVLSFSTASNYLSLRAIPKLSRYSSILYYNLKLDCNNYFDLHFNFNERAFSEGFYTFFLSDENYGLPIDGELNFNLS